MLPIAQGNALGKRRPRLIHSAFLRLRKNATRRKRVTHYALNATRGVAPHKAGCSYRARHFNQCNIVPPGRCPGLSAAIGLTARHTCAANAVKSCIYMNVCARRAQRPTNLFDRAMPSRRQTSVENEHLCKASRSRKCREKVHEYENFFVHELPLQFVDKMITNVSLVRETPFAFCLRYQVEEFA